jgi:general secretion pathway protein L
MIKYIIVRLMSYPNESIEWIIENENKKLIMGSQRGHNIQTAIADLKNYHVIVLVPGNDVYLTEVKLPRLSQTELVKAIPYALEENLADSISNLHFAIGTAKQNNIVPVAVVSKINMDSWKSRLDYFLKSPHLLINSFLPDTMILPWKPKEWTIFIDNEMALVRTDFQAGFSVELKSFWTVITMILLNTDTERPSTIEVIGDIIIPAQITTLFKQLQIISHQRHKIHLLNFVGTYIPALPPINLLQGSYKNSTPINKNKFLYYSMMAFLIALLLIYTFGNMLQVLILEHQKYTIHQHIVAQFSQFYPEKKISYNKIKEYLQHELDTAQANYKGSHFLGILEVISPIISHYPGIKILGLEYADRQLTLDLEANDFVLLDSLTHDLNQNNIKAEQLEAKIIGNNVQASVSIRENIQ